MTSTTSSSFAASCAFAATGASAASAACTGFPDLQTAIAATPATRSASRMCSHPQSCIWPNGPPWPGFAHDSVAKRRSRIVVLCTAAIMPSMDKRTFLKTMTAVGAVGVSGTSVAKSGYDPGARMAVRVSEVEYRRTAKGRSLLARIYQPQGSGPFPMVLDLHGGAWSGKDRYANEPMSRAVAESGVVVVAIDMTLAAEAPYPASVQDANYAVRWMKAKASGWKGDP